MAEDVLLEQAQHKILLASASEINGKFSEDLVAQVKIEILSDLKHEFVEKGAPSVELTLKNNKALWFDKDNAVFRLFLFVSTVDENGICR